MRDRLELHEILCNALGSRQVYYHPPESIKMKYPAIVYSMSTITDRYADDLIYKDAVAYNVIYISNDPVYDKMLDKIRSIPYCRFDRMYVADNLKHFSFTINY